MKRSGIRPSLRVLALCVMVGIGGGLAAPAGYAQETLRPEVGRPLQAAQELMKARKFKEALAKVREAEAVSGRTAYENFILERMRGSAAAAAGDTDLAAKSFEAVINSGRLPEAEQMKLMEALAGTYYRGKDYDKAVAWAQRYFKAGGSAEQMRTLLVQAQYLGGDYAAAARQLSAEVAGDERNGRKPAEQQLQLLANAQLKLNDAAGYADTLQKLVVHHPKKEYWADLLARIQRRPGFSDRFALDIFRLMAATGNLSETGDYMEMAQLALQAGLPAEAKKVVDEGYAKGALGKGAEAERHRRLKDLAERQLADDEKTMAENEKQAMAAKEGDALVNLGYAHITMGRYESGLALMEQGIARGGLKRPEDAELRLGVAQLQAGAKARAVQTLRGVRGADGVADLARLWIALGSKSN